MDDVLKLVLLAIVLTVVSLAALGYAETHSREDQ